MDKYEGIERADGEVYENAVVIKRKERRYGVLFRVLAAGLITAVAFAGKWIDHPIADGISSAAKSIVGYDFLQSEDPGSIPAMEAFEKTEEK